MTGDEFNGISTIITACATAMTVILGAVTTITWKMWKSLVEILKKNQEMMERKVESEQKLRGSVEANTKMTIETKDAMHEVSQAIRQTGDRFTEALISISRDVPRRRNSH